MDAGCHVNKQASAGEERRHVVPYGAGTHCSRCQLPTCEEWFTMRVK